MYDRMAVELKMCSKYTLSLQQEQQREVQQATTADARPGNSFWQLICTCF
jgi:hypothetical protein